MELEWTRDFPFPSGSIKLPATTAVEYWPTFEAGGSGLRLIVGQRGLDGFTIYVGGPVLEAIKRALLNPEELILADKARDAAAARRRGDGKITIIHPAAPTKEEM